MKKRRKPWFGFGTLMAGLIALCGGLALYVGGTRVYYSYASLRWPAARGSIIGSSLSVHRDHDGDRYFTPEITYTYAVGSDTYVGSRVRFASANCPEQPAREIVGKYPRATAVLVFYNPTNPGLSVLEPGVHPNTWPYAILGAIILAGVAIGCRLYWVLKGKAAADRAAARQELLSSGTPSPASGPSPAPAPSPPEDRPAGNGMVSNVLWIAATLAVCWWIGSCQPDDAAAGAASPLREAIGFLTGGRLNIILSFAASVLAVLAGITAVYASRAISTVPPVTPIGNASASTPPPAPRDALERQLQAMSFHYIGDFDVTVFAHMPGRLRAYCDPDRLCAVALFDITSAGRTTTILEFGTTLHPSGSITTNTNPFPDTYAYPPDKVVIRAPWKKTPAALYALHRLLCRAAQAENFAAQTVHAADLAERVRQECRRDLEYQVQVGRLRRVAEDRYLPTLLGTVLSVPLIWWQMVYGHAFTWVRISDSVFCERLRRRLRRVKRGAAGR